MSRIETGALQIGDDWPGIFIRGDHAIMGYAPALKYIIDNYEIEDLYTKVELNSLYQLLTSCNLQKHSEYQKIEVKS